MAHKDYVAAIQAAADRASLPLERARGGRIACDSGPPLGAGHTSRAEFMDFRLTGPVSPVSFRARLARELPDGIDVLWARRFNLNPEHIRSQIVAFEYEVCAGFDHSRAAAYELAATWPLARIRKNRIRHLDLKRSIRQLRMVSTQKISFVIHVRPEGTPKPEEVVAAIFDIPGEAAAALPFERTAVRFASRKASYDNWEPI